MDNTRVLAIRNSLFNITVYVLKDVQTHLENIYSQLKWLLSSGDAPRPRGELSAQFSKQTHLDMCKVRSRYGYKDVHGSTRAHG